MGAAQKLYRRFRPARGEKGQVSIMIGMMMLTFVLFFAFVVNTGMLVNAKINLQNAADMAAYAGAAQQARMLNDISFLNYEMRRQYKKFLFRYYVLGTMSYDTFPRGGAGSGPMPWQPDNGSNHSFQVPAVCMVFGSTDNPCQVLRLPEIHIPQSNPLDSINTTLIAQLKEIEKIRKKSCQVIGVTNSTVLTLWLYNADPWLTQLENALPTGEDLKKTFYVIKDLSQGMGLIPRELLLRMRIKTLQRYVNAPPETGVTKAKVDVFRGAADPFTRERTINAFLSAYNTLGNNTFSDDNSIQMDELLPQGTNGAQLLALKDIPVTFDTYSVDFVVNSGACDARLVPMILPSKGLITGVYKDPSVLTYYAVRLKAKAKIMFSPFGDMELKAYSAAQPFGSRIGPPLSEADFVRDDAVSNPAPTNLHIWKQIPNLAILKGDATGPGKGWDSANAVASYYSALSPPTNVRDLINSSHMNRGYQAAMAPNPIEGNQYNIPVDAGDYFNRLADREGKIAIWAPIFDVTKMSDAAGELDRQLNDLLPDLQDGVIATQDTAALKEGLKRDLTEYVRKLENGQGEDGEGFKVVRILDPSTTRWDDVGNGGSRQPIQLGGGLLLNDPKGIRTSWGFVNESRYQNGRIGYSVKFTAFENLVTSTKRLPASSKGDSWQNAPQGGSEADADFPTIKH